MPYLGDITLRVCIFVIQSLELVTPFASKLAITSMPIAKATDDVQILERGRRIELL